MVTGDDSTDEPPAAPPLPPPPLPPPPLPPVPPSPWPAGTGAPRPRRSIWPILASALAVALAALLVVGFTYHVDRRLIRPGDATPLSAGVTIRGAKAYPPKGSFLLLTVFVDDHPSLVRYLQEKLFDGDVTEDTVPPPSPVNSDQQNVCDMTDSQATAKLVALTKLGYKPQALPGVQIQVVEPAPAAAVLQCGDVIDSVNGHPTRTPTDLQQVLASHKPGDRVDVTFRRGTTTATKPVQLACADPDPQRSGRDLDPPGSAACSATGAKPRIGILVDVQYRYPVNIDINTGDVSGPSGGLAMTLTLLDLLTPCNLTGGQKIAVTGTINPDETVGGIGGTPKKVIAARHAGARLFIVAASSDDMAAARKAAKGMKFVVVHDLDEALKALQDNGGDPLSCTTPPPHG